MSLTGREIEKLLRLTALTREHEIDCDGCLTRIAEFAEQRLAGKSVSDALEAVQRHLSICAECNEEYEALQRALKSLAD